VKAKAWPPASRNDLERAVSDGPRLLNQLKGPLLGDLAVTLFEALSAASAAASPRTSGEMPIRCAENYRSTVSAPADAVARSEVFP
jgi:hypothetical protein